MEELPEVHPRPGSPIVGDLHVQSFGTWRDHEQVRRWGVDDRDELEALVRTMEELIRRDLDGWRKCHLSG